MDPKVIAVIVGMLLCLSSSVSSAMSMGGGDGESSGGGAGGAGPSSPSYPDHPLHGEHWLIRAAKFSGETVYFAIKPDPSNEKLVSFDTGNPKNDSSKMIFEPVESKPNTYRLKNKGTGKYWAYAGDGFWSWTTNPTEINDILFEEMREDNGKMMYRLGNTRGKDGTVYFGYHYDGKAIASFNPDAIKDGDHLFKIE